MEFSHVRFAHQGVLQLKSSIPCRNPPKDLCHCHTIWSHGPLGPAHTPFVSHHLMLCHDCHPKRRMSWTWPPFHLVPYTSVVESIKSVLSVCVSVRLSVSAFMAEPFDPLGSCHGIKSRHTIISHDVTAIQCFHSL